LNAVLANTDGNGDHYLDEGATITLQKDGELDVDCTIVNEGGPRSRFVSAHVCK